MRFKKLEVVAKTCLLWSRLKTLVFFGRDSFTSSMLRWQMCGLKVGYSSKILETINHKKNTSQQPFLYSRSWYRLQLIQSESLFCSHKICLFRLLFPRVLRLIQLYTFVFLLPNGSWRPMVQSIRAGLLTFLTFLTTGLLSICLT